MVLTMDIVTDQFHRNNKNLDMYKSGMNEWMNE